MKVLYNNNKGLSRVSCKMNVVKKPVADRFASAIGEILSLFQKTNEVGRIDKPIIVSILKPLKDSKIYQKKHIAA